MVDEAPAVTKLEPEGVQNGARAEKFKRKLNDGIEFAIPLVVVGHIGFYFYAFCYVIVWGHVRTQNRGAAIALVSLFSALIAYVGTVWALMFVYGPGKVDDNYPLAGTDDDPFVCDMNGYAFWCSHCKHAKPTKCHHSSKTNTCVPVMDHYCIWLGTVVGQRNRRLFMQLVVAMWSVLALVLVTLLVYQHDPLPKMSGLAIPVYVTDGFWLPFVTAVMLQHFKYVLLGQTTIDMLDVRRDAPLYVNLAVGDTRRIVTVHGKEDLVPGPFSLGAWSNIIFIMGPVWTWVLPLPGKLQEPSFNDAAISKIKQVALQDIENEANGLAPTPPAPAPTRKKLRLCAGRAPKQTV